MLRDDELQKIIQRIDLSVNPKKDLDKAMEGLAFKKFTDKILAVIRSNNAPVPKQPERTPQVL